METDLLLLSNIKWNLKKRKHACGVCSTQDFRALKREAEIHLCNVQHRALRLLFETGKWIETKANKHINASPNTAHRYRTIQKYIALSL